MLDRLTLEPNTVSPAPFRWALWESEWLCCLQLCPVQGGWEGRLGQAQLPVVEPRTAMGRDTQALHPPPASHTKVQPGSLIYSGWTRGSGVLPWPLKAAGPTSSPHLSCGVKQLGGWVQDWVCTTSRPGRTRWRQGEARRHARGSFANCTACPLSSPGPPTPRVRTSALLLMVCIAMGALQWTQQPPAPYGYLNSTFNQLKLNKVITLVPSHTGYISSVHQAPVASGYLAGQCKHRHSCCLSSCDLVRYVCVSPLAQRRCHDPPKAVTSDPE